MSATVPRPPALEGFPAPRLVDVVRMTGWSLRGFAHGAMHGRPLARLGSAVLVPLWFLAMLMLAVPLWGQWVATKRPSARYYMAPERDVVLAIVASGASWDVAEHYSARPGTGRGRALRAALLPALVPAADEAGVAVILTAASPTLAALYAAELPGLVVVGRAVPRGLKMRREPGSSPQPGTS